MLHRCMYLAALSFSISAFTQQPQTAAATPRVAKLITGPDLGYLPVRDALPIPASMENVSVAAVAINSKNHIFVYQRSPVPLLEFDENGKFIRAFGEDYMAVAKNGDIYVADTDNRRIQKFVKK